MGNILGNIFRLLCASLAFDALRISVAAYEIEMDGTAFA